LIAEGVDASKIEIIVSEEDAVEAALEKCEQGDLLLIFADHISRTWKQIVQRGGETKKEVQAAEPTSLGLVSEESYPEFEPPAGQKVLRDGRGVLLVVDEEAD